MTIEILHSFVNIFAGGRSGIKAIFFILYLLFLCILFLSLRKFSFQNFKWVWFAIALFIMYIYGLALHIFYTFSNNLSITDFFITGGNGEISSSVIYHTHIAKGVVGEVFHLFGKTQLQTMDAGGAYIGIFPSPVFLLGAVLLLITILQAILYFVTSFKKFLENKNKRQIIFLIAGYAILSFSLIKTSIDGGVLNPAFYIGVAFIIFFVLRIKNKLTISHYYLATIFSSLLLFISLYFYYFEYSNAISIAYIATLFLLYIFILYGSEEKIRLQLFISILILFLAGWWVASVRDRDIFDYSQISLEKGKEVYVYDYDNREVEIFKIDEQKSVGQFSKQLNKNITYMPIAISGVTCISRAPVKEFSTTLISSSPITESFSNSSEYLWIKNENSIRLGQNWHTKIQIFINDCTPEPLSVIDGELNKNNISNYILVNPSFYDRIDYK